MERGVGKAGRTGGVWWSEPCSSWLFVVQGLREEYQLGGNQFLLALLVTRHEHVYTVALSGEETNLALMKPVQKVKSLSKTLAALTPSAISHSYLEMLPVVVSSVLLSSEVPKRWCKSRISA